MGQTLAGRGGLVRPPLIRLIGPPSGNPPDRTSIRPAADPGVRLEMPSRVLGGGGIRVSRERRALAGGAFPVYADGRSAEATDRHPPGGWAKGRSTCLCR